MMGDSMTFKGGMSPRRMWYRRSTCLLRAVQEGTVGAGTGMVSYGFKGGIGTSSRRLPEAEGGYTIGVLVNANHGRRPELVVGGVPVGRLYETPSPVAQGISPGQSEGSIIVLIATDAPLDSRQLTRLAKRAALGLARTGSTARHGSGDFMLAFSTGNIIPHYPKEPTFQHTPRRHTSEPIDYGDGRSHGRSYSQRTDHGHDSSGP
jgi:L-aminopeptidase/D-esterase